MCGLLCSLGPLDHRAFSFADKRAISPLMEQEHSHDHHHDDEHEPHHHGGHGHSHAPANFGAAFAIGTSLNLGYVLVQVGFGLFAHSLALLADAGHNLSDVFGLLLAWWASRLVKTLPTQRHTYGLGRSSILAALANACFLLIAIGGISWEAVRRFAHPSVVEGGVVMWVAGIGILVNAGTALLFASGRKDDLNIRGTFLHMASDAVVSLGVVLAGGAILLTGWLWLDPAVSLIVNAVILMGTWRLLKDSVNLALDAVPEGIQMAEVRTYLETLPGVMAVHDLHVWALSTTQTALTAHLVKPDAKIDDELLVHACEGLRDRFKINHSTIQLETGDEAHPCPLAPETVI
jgi:cobalt-zinc-cadmium efflux system protein